MIWGEEWQRLRLLIGYTPSGGSSTHAFLTEFAAQRVVVQEMINRYGTGTISSVTPLSSEAFEELEDFYSKKNRLITGD